MHCASRAEGVGPFTWGARGADAVRMATRVLAVEAGQVSCPESGQVSVERCLTCPRFSALLAGDDPDTAAVRCRPERTGLTATWGAYADTIGHFPG